MKTLTTLIGSLVLVSGLAFAGDDTQTKDFSQLDKDQDGAITMAEASADKHTMASFKQADANSDGYLTKDEYDQYQQESEDAE
ncbi:MAG TPA: hypothetical protein PKK10_05110 [Woeseiaceae bacterium]|nr:hypothetical protein [Woeseiaceae bacterium]